VTDPHIDIGTDSTGEATNLTVERIRTDDLCEVVITAPDAAWLADFVRGLIADRLCAGSHHTEQIRSIYPWRGEVHDTTEARVAFRTRTALLPAIVERTRAAHPYEVPGVVALPIIAANPDYAAWIRDNTRAPG
jgi:periplasmic divalent cation tolerance protein